MLLWLGSVALAEPEFVPEVQVRPRTEAHTGRDGERDAGEVWFVSQRARLGGTVKTESFEARAVFQDIRLWGSEDNTIDASSEAVDVHYAYASILFNESSMLRLGRQEFSLHEERLIGSLNWLQQGRSFDGIRLSGSSGNLSGDLNGFILTEGDQISPDDPDAFLVVARGGWAADGRVADAVFITDTNGSIDRNRITAGAYIAQKQGVISGRIEGYVQAGSVGDTSISAWLAAAQVTFAPEANLKPKISLWYDHLSGDDDLTDDTNRAFDTLFATNHKFYGLIDIATFSTGGIVDGRGLQNAAAKFSVRPVKKSSVHLDLHLFLASAAQNLDGQLAQEADLWFRHTLTRGLKVDGGVSVWLPNEGAGLGPDPDLWGWLQLNAAL
ncbi:MAG: alginate export family protein [Myxococcota bacterium]